MSKERILLNLSLEDFEEFEAKRELTGMDRQKLVHILLKGIEPFYKIEDEVGQVLSTLNSVNLDSQTMSWMAAANKFPTANRHKANMKWLYPLISAICMRNVKWKFNNESTNEKAGSIDGPALNFVSEKINEGEIE